MTRKQFDKIMGNDDAETNIPEGCNAVIGLKIIQKYLPLNGIEAADHDIIYSVDVDKIVEAGITEEDAKRLREINWMIDSEADTLACYV